MTDQSEKDKEENSYLKIGEIELSSPKPIKDLFDLLLIILQNKEIEKYLQIVQAKRMTAGTYLG